KDLAPPPSAGPLCDADITPVYSVPPASYPKPWLGAQPAAVVTPGVNVTLSCRAPQPAWRFALFKSGRIIPVLYRGVSMELAEFFLEEVTPAQGGSYHCCYRRLGWGLGVWSHPSDTLELLVTGEVLGPYPLLPKPKGSGPLLALTHLNFETGNCVCSLTLEVRDQEGRAGRNWVRKLKTPLPRCPAGSGSLDYTQGNLVRLGLAGLVLLSLGTLVFLDWRGRSRIPCSVRP
uniref:Osteoclast associated Ig-like receptor n=1 Tax=Panthera tigris altaica TaxID=74533 RepID=A0A8C9JC42_PANTA